MAIPSYNNVQVYIHTNIQHYGYIHKYIYKIIRQYNKTLSYNNDIHLYIYPQAAVGRRNCTLGIFFLRFFRSVIVRFVLNCTVDFGNSPTIAMITKVQHAATIIFFVVALSCMGWLLLVGSVKLQVSFAEYRLFCSTFLQKRPVI